MNDYDSKDIYLRKPGQTTYVGLHSIGEDNAEWEVTDFNGVVYKKTGFHAFESWGNEYLNGKMQGGSFRVFGDIENAAKEFEADEYERFEVDHSKFNKKLEEVLK